MKKLNKHIVKRSHHKMVSQLDIIARLVAPGMTEWAPASHKTTSLGLWCGPLPRPDGMTISAELLGSVVAEGRPIQWYVGVTPNSNGTLLVCSFVVRVGARHCPNPRWWKLNCVDQLTADVQLHWAEKRKADIQ